MTTRKTTTQRKDIDVKGGIAFATSQHSLEARLPGGDKIVLATRLKFGQLLAIAPLALQMEEGELSEGQIVAAMTGDLIPDDVRTTLNDLWLDEGLIVFVRWLQEALKGLEALGEIGASS